MKNKYLFLQVICSILFTSTFYGQERVTSNLNHPRMNWWKEAIFDIDLGKVYELQGCYLGEPWKWKNMKQEHQLFYFKDSEWKSILSGSTNGSGFSEFFSPITTRKLRLILVNEKEPPAARELLFF